MDIWSILDHANKVWGLLAAVGCITWAARRLRKPDVVVEVARDPSTLPPGLLEAFRGLVAAARQALDAMPVPTEDRALEAREDLRTTANSDMASTVKRYRTVEDRIVALRLSVRNCSSNPIDGVRIYLESSWGSPVWRLWSVDIDGAFLTLDAVAEFRRGVHEAPNFVLPPLPPIPSKSVLQIIIYGDVRDCEVKVDAKDLKSRVEPVITAKSTRLVRAALSLQKDPWVVVGALVMLAYVVLKIWDDLGHR
jgi:hypothetical protein